MTREAFEAWWKLTEFNGTSAWGIWQASRAAALEEAMALYDQGDVAAPVGNSAYGEAYQDGWIAGTQSYLDAILELIKHE